MAARSERDSTTRRTLFVNATFLTMDPARPEARALLAEDGRIALAGAEPDLRAAAPDAAVVDLGGRTALPGFVDPHNHFSLTALAPFEIDCRMPPLPSLDALLDRVHAAAAATPPGRWLRGHGYDEALLGGRHPTRQELDAVAPEHPVVLVHWTVHRCVANSTALRLAGISEESGDPPGGWLVRGPEGSLTGLAYERATDPLQSASIAAYAAQSGERLPALFREAARLQLREGITGLGDAYVHPALAPVYDAADLPLAVRPFCGSRAGLFSPPWECAAPSERPDSGSLRSAGIKVFTDGGGNTTSASLASGRPPRFLFYRQEELDDLIARAHGAGLPIAVHAAGDIGVTMALDAFARARGRHPDIRPRFRIEHAITVKQRDIARFRELDVALVTQPEAIFLSGARLAAASLAEGVRIAPYRDLLDAGVALAFSSDSPCYALTPLWQIWCAVTRAGEGGRELADGQGVTPAEALAAYTRSAAAAAFTADVQGMLAPGLRADFNLLSHDPRTLPLHAWNRLRVEAVYLAGAQQSFAGLDQIPAPGRSGPL